VKGRHHNWCLEEKYIMCAESASDGAGERDCEGHMRVTKVVLALILLLALCGAFLRAWSAYWGARLCSVLWEQDRGSQPESPAEAEPARLERVEEGGAARPSTFALYSLTPCGIHLRPKKQTLHKHSCLQLR
ncbi:unnamed protein product, partial [Prorocentrum cordatum]